MVTEFKGTSLFTIKDFNKKGVTSGMQNLGKEEIAHKAFKPLLFVALSMAVMPLYGISGNNSSKIQFKWMSWRALLATVMIIFDLALIGITIFHRGINRGSTGSLVFYSVTALGMIFFIRLGCKWKDVIRKFTEATDFLDFQGDKAIRKLKLITITLVFLSVGEHTLANVNAYFKDLTKEGDGLKVFLLNKFFFIFNFTDYAVWKGLLLIFIHLQTTIVWNLIDIFIINIATLLSDMLKFYNNSISSTLPKSKSLAYWKKKRETYSVLVSLVKEINHKISNLVVLSFGSNLFFICMQLYYNLTVQHPSTVKSLYFLISFGFLLMRTCFVCMSASSVYERSQTTMDILFALPTSQFNVEVERLLDTVRGETLAVTGYNFFTVNRKLMLTVAGTIATYELVLVQFKSFQEQDK
nr:gustatory receptor 6 [Tropidothorax elegans]